MLLDPSGTIAQRLQVTAVPVTFVLDRDGRITARQEGQSARRTLSARQLDGIPDLTSKDDTLRDGVDGRGSTSDP